MSACPGLERERGVTEPAESSPASPTQPSAGQKMAVSAHTTSTGGYNTLRDMQNFLQIFAWPFNVYLFNKNTPEAFSFSDLIDQTTPVWSPNVDVFIASSRVLSQCAGSATTEQVALSVCRQTSSSHFSCAIKPMGKQFANPSKGEAF